MKLLRKLTVPIALLLLIKILFLAYFFNSLEHRTQDSLFRLRGVKPVSGDVIIVAVDDVTFQALNRSWPFPRELHAKLIENLSLAGARQIIFDIEFTEDSSPLSDMMLAGQAKVSNNVIFAGKYIRSLENPEHVQMQQPISAITSANLNWGIVNMPMDRDGFIRNYTLFEEFDQKPVYSLGVAGLGNWRVYDSQWQSAILREKHQLKVADHVIPITNRNQAMINFYGPAGTFKHISYSSVLDDSTMTMPGYEGVEIDEFYDLMASGIFKDKIVMIGATIDELHDKFPTAFSNKMTSGVEIHANFIQMVRDGNYLHDINFWLFFLIELLFACTVYLLISWLKPVVSAGIILFLILAVLFGSFLLFTKANTHIPVVEVVFLLIFLYVTALISHYLRSQKEKKFIKNAFQQYLAPELVNELLKHPDNLKYGGAMQELTVLFSDIVSFTTYSEKHTPQETVQILKGYLTEMVKTIIANGGIVDKFVGDEIMALYGVPIYTDNHALQACKTALDMRSRLDELLVRWQNEGVEPFDFGIGINTGQAVVGNLGSEQIFDYTAIGDTINLGARLEAKTRDYDTKHKIIISETTYQKVKDQVEVRYLDDVKVKGKDISVKIYELLAIL
jgi:adenylate cyclase